MKNKALKMNVASFVFMSVFVFLALFSSVCAQEAEASKSAFIEQEYDVTIKDINLLFSGKTKIILWGIDKISTDTAVFNLKARKDLEDRIGDAPILCTIKAKSKNYINAQCINKDEEDLSLFLLQQGLVSADRTTINGTLYEDPYLQAEQEAQDDLRGVWSEEYGYMSAAGDKQSKNFMLGAFLLVAVFIMALIVLGFFVMRGFGRVIDVQSRSLDLAIKERSLKDKEKMVIASMINSEVSENKAKIEAYLMIYEEVLKEFVDDDMSAKYMKTGEVVQKQPSLSRTVFDGNTSKLDLFGSELSSSMIHYYARIKTNPDYVEITPETPYAEAKEIVTAAVDNARKLDDIADDLLSMVTDYAALCVTQSEESSKADNV